MTEEIKQKPKRNTNAARPKKKPADDHTPGLACTYTPMRAEYVCDIVARNAMGLEKLHRLFKEDGFPDQDTILRWRRVYPEFATKFLEAKAFLAMICVEQIYELADNAEADLIATDKGLVPNSNAVSRSRLQIETRKWAVERLLPKLYGTRSYVENNVSIKHEDALQELE